MRRLIKFTIPPVLLLLCGLTGCVVAAPERRPVVVERPAPVYARPAPAIVIRP